MITLIIVMALQGGPPPRQALPPMPVTQIDDRPRSADLDGPRRVSISFGEPAPISEVLRLLLRDTPFSLALDPDAAGTFVGELKEVSLRQAIEAVLVPRGLEYEVRGTLIRVFARHTDTRLFDLNLLNVHRGWQRTIASSDGTVLASSAGQPDPLDDIQKGIDSMLSPAGRAHVDRRSGLAQVTDYVDRLDRVGLYLEALQIRAARQVRIEGRLLEIRLKDRPSVDWGAVRQKLGLASTNVGIAARDTASIEDALTAQGELRVLATAYVIAMNNEAAMLRADTPDESSFTLTVVPQVSSDGHVQLSVSPSWSERAGAVPADGHDAPAMRVSQADTVARVMDGDTVLLAGLLGTQTSHAELVVLLTPTVITPPPVTAVGGKTPGQQ